MRAVWRKGWADLWQRKGQSALILLTVGVAAAMLYIGLVILTGSSAAYGRLMDRTQGAHAFLLLRSGEAADRLAAAIRQQPEVVSSVQRPAWLAPIRLEKDGAESTVVMTAVEPGPAAAMGWRIMEGRELASTDTGGALMSISLARFYGIHVGDTVQINTPAGLQPLQVVGIEADPMWSMYPLTTFQNLFVLPATLERFSAGAPYTGTVLGLRLSNPAEAGPFLYRAALLPGGDQVLFKISWLATRQFLFAFQAFSNVFLLFFAGLAVLAAGMITANIVAGAVLNGYREIGIIKTLGFTRTQVLLLFLGQNLTLGLAGSAVGLAAGHWAVLRMAKPLADNTGNPEVLSFHLAVAAVVTGGVLFITGLTTAMAAQRAIVVRPAQALRGVDAPERAGGPLLTRVFAWLRLPIAVQLGIRDATMRRSRAAVTLLSVFLCALAVPMVVSTSRFVDRMATDLETVGVPFDLIASVDARPLSAARQQVEAIDGVEQVYPEFQFSAQVPEQEHEITVSAAGPGWEKLPWQILQGRAIRESGEVMLAPIVMKNLNAKIGDRVRFQVGDRSAWFTVVGEYANSLELGRIAFISLDDLPLLRPDAAPTDLRIRVKRGVDPAAVAATLRSAGGGQYHVVLLREVAMHPMIKEMLDRSGTLVLALVLMAALSVLNTTLLGAREQMREAAVRKAVGMTPAQVITAAAAGGAWLGLIGAAFGVPVGVLLNRVVIQMLTEQLGVGKITIGLPLSVTLLLVAGSALLAALAALPAALLAARLRTARVLAAE
ncbi:MAG: FtsX-like permease family protein [Mycobacterium leprae]